MAHSNLGKLYLIPVPIAEVDHRTCLPEYNRELLPTIRHYIVENIRSARRFLKAADRNIDIDSITFYELNKHTPEGAIGEYLRPAQAGEPGIEVVPLVGPSSILMALMGSGFNGQGFAFVGYLPIEDARRVQTLKELEHRVRTKGETQIFIETPYRNVQLVEQLIRHCSPDLKLCIASGISSEGAILRTRKLSAWRGNIPQIHKVPTIFLIGQ